jgi:hypothetical protein
MPVADGEGERRMAVTETDMTADQEYIWLLRGQDLALEALKDFPKPYSHMELDLLRIGREAIEQAVDSVIHSEELAGREPRCRQLISEGAYLTYSEWATKEMVFSEGATSE